VIVAPRGSRFESAATSDWTIPEQVKVPSAKQV
jgi:hypothetical protein